MIIDTNLNQTTFSNISNKEGEKSNANFDSALEQSQQDSRYVKEKTQEEIIENMEKLIKDIDSVMRTGMTEEELKELEEMLKRIQDEMNEKYPNEKKIKELLDELEKEIARLQKEITGEAVIEADDVKQNETTATQSSTSINIQERFEKAQQAINEFKEFNETQQPKQLYSQSELLQQIKQFQN